MYYWSVVAENTGGATTATGAPWHFTTIIAAPAGFTLLAPADSALNQPITGNLIWEASARADSFAVYFDTLNPPTTLLRRVAGNVPTTAYAGINSQLYYWSVKAENVGGITTASGAPWHFTTIVGSGIAEEGATNVAPGMTISPNPLSTGRATLRYSLPQGRDRENLRRGRDGPSHHDPDAQRGPHRFDNARPAPALGRGVLPEAHGFRVHGLAEAGHRK